MFKHLIIIVLLVFGAVPNGYSAKKIVLPAWVSMPQEDTLTAMYGVGSGTDRAQAKQAALDDIAGKIITRIESSTYSNTVVNRYGSAETFKSTISTKIEEFALSGYEVTLEEKLKKRYWVQIKLNVATFIDVSHQEFTVLNQAVYAHYKKIKQATVLHSLRPNTMLFKHIDTAIHRATILGAVDSRFAAKDAIEKLNGILLDLRNRRKNLVVYVAAAPELKLLATAVAAKLSQYGIATTKQAVANIPTLKLSGNFLETVNFNRPVVTANIVFVTFDEYGNELASRTLKLAGSSVSSHALAKKAAVNRFIATLNKSNIEKTLGLTTKRR